MQTPPCDTLFSWFRRSVIAIFYTSNKCSLVKETWRLQYFATFFHMKLVRWLRRWRDEEIKIPLLLFLEVDILVLMYMFRIFFRNACTKSGSLRFSQFSGCWLILSVYIIMSFDFPFVILLLPLCLLKLSSLENQIELIGQVYMSIHARTNEFPSLAT